MEPASPMVRLISVAGAFPARVLAARLRSVGVPSELHGTTGGPYPLPGLVDVLVPVTKLLLAREVLLADAVDALFSPSRPLGRAAALRAGHERRTSARRRRLRRRLRRRQGR
ncbi:MAG: hypothetical protein M0014_02325 [Actinomycetota bacterium]|jgi:hypothetical protein|nr:hypothetical protein [Actinomycetota bacterium]